MDYTSLIKEVNIPELVKALTCGNDGKLPCHNNECPYWVDQWHGIGLCNVIKKDAAAAAAIEGLEALLTEADKKQAYQHDRICELTAENEDLQKECKTACSDCEYLKKIQKELEPKRGEWKVDMSHFSPYIVCSVCGVEIPCVAGWCMDAHMNYCPNCGADMRAKMEVQDG